MLIMKKKYSNYWMNSAETSTAIRTFLMALFVGCIGNFASAQVASSTWTLTSNGNPANIGNVTSAISAFGAAINTPAFTVAAGESTVSWSNNALNLAPNEYYEFKVTPNVNTIFTVTAINFEHSISNGNWQVQAYYSTDNFTTSTAIAIPFSSNSTTPVASNNSVNINVDNVNLSVRIYGWGSDGNNRSLRIRNVVISGSTCTKPVAASTISGTATVCQGQATVGYSVPLITNATSYNWAYSGIGATITGTTNTPTLTFSASATSGNLTVKGTNSCGNGTVSANYPITVTPTVGTPTAITISAGSEPSCQLTNGTTTTSYASTATNNTGFNWSLSNPAAGSIGPTTGIMTWTNGFSGTVAIQVTANGCNGSISPVVIRTVTVNPLPLATGIITGSATVCQGQASVVYSVPTTTNATSYTWSYSGTGATLLTTLNSVSINFTANATSGNLSVYGVNSCGNGTVSAIYPLTINSLPVITNQPVPSQIVCEGNAASLNIVASGDGLSYQWFKGSTLISGETTSTLTFTSLVLGDGGTYHCVVSGTGSCNPVSSNNSILNVNQGPVIITLPASSQTVCEGDLVHFTIGATNGVLSYQWYKGAIALTNSGTISGADSATLTINSVKTTDADQKYNCIVSNSCSTEVSYSELIVNPKPNAIATNSAQTICSASAIATMVLSGNVSGTTFSWIRNNSSAVTGIADIGNGNISGSLTNATNAPVTVDFTITPTSNGCFGTPITATVLVNPTPNAIATPVSQTICSANAITATVLTGNVTGTTFNWIRDNTVSVSGIAASGSGNINGSLTNSTNAPVTVAFTITPTANSCAGTPTTATAIVQAASVAGAVTISLPNDLPVIKSNTVCHFATGSIYLSGQMGSILRWESSITGGVSWVDIGNTGNATYNYINITQTTLFRAVVQNASCTIVFSATAMINVIPNIKPDPVSATPLVICNGDSSILTSGSGFATSQNLATGGVFDIANPAGWLVDSTCGNCLNAGGDNGAPTRFRETNGDTIYGSTGKFAIVRGAFNSTLETPLFNTLGLSTASLNFNTAYQLLAGASAKVELSLDGGLTYTIVLVTYGTGNQGPYKPFTTNMNIDLSPYVGQTNLKIRFNYLGTTTSSWAIDNIRIPEAPVGSLTSQWIDTNTNSIISDTTNATVSPTITTTYGVTSFLNGCTSSGAQGTTYITITVNARPTAKIGINQTVCYNGTAALSVALTGVAPWIIKYSDGTTTTVSTSTNPFFFSIPNITTSRSYTITALSDANCTAKPSDLTGTSIVTVLNGTPGLWTGLVSTDWFDCLNWAGGLPSSTIEAQIPAIPSGGPRMPIIDRNSPLAPSNGYATAKNLIIANGASLTMVATNNSELQISQDWKNSGTFIPGTGTVTFNGSTLNQIQNINLGIKTYETFYNLTTNNSGGAKGISVVDGFELTVSNNISLLSGDLRLTGEAQLVQAGTTANPTAGSGMLLRDQQGQQNSFNYNYWSSPVSSSADFAHYSVGGVLRDGTDVTNSISPLNFNQKSITFGDGAYFADGPLSNPIKISNRWLWIYGALTPGSNTPIQNYNQWNYVSNTGLIKIGEGFTMKGTGGIASITATQNYVFAGKPNSGTISIQLPLNDTHLIGNPYPSALDADQFIRDNLRDCIGCTSSANVFGGALYFWDHFYLSNNHVLAQYQGGYASYTLMGGVNAIANVALTANTSAAGSKIPKRYIPVGQAFFVDAVLDTTLPTTTPNVDGGSIVFKNSQRAFVRENSGTSLFMKTSGTKNSKISENADTRSKIRLGFDSSVGKHREILVGADANTTPLFDIGYDAEMYDTNEDDMYWNFSDRQFVIQGIPDFNIDRIIPLGIVIANQGLVTIKIDALENISSGTEIFLFDSSTEIYNPISASAFTIYLPVGQYNNRFSLTFTDKTLSVPNLKENTEIIILYSDNNKTLNIRNNTSDSTVNSVNLYNMLGQSIAKWNVENSQQTNIQIPIKNLSSGVYIAKVKTTNGHLSKKIIVY